MAWPLEQGRSPIQHLSLCSAWAPGGTALWSGSQHYSCSPGTACASRGKGLWACCSHLADFLLVPHRKQIQPGLEVCGGRRPPLGIALPCRAAGVPALLPWHWALARVWLEGTRLCILSGSSGWCVAVGSAVGSAQGLQPLRSLVPVGMWSAVLDNEPGPEVPACAQERVCWCARLGACRALPTADFSSKGGFGPLSAQQVLGAACPGDAAALLGHSCWPVAGPGSSWGLEVQQRRAAGAQQRSRRLCEVHCFQCTAAAPVGTRSDSLLCWPAGGGGVILNFLVPGLGFVSVAVWQAPTYGSGHFLRCF